MGERTDHTGPVVSIPTKSAYEGDSCIHVLPDTLHIEGRVLQQLRHRAIFDAVLYNAQLVLTGSFSYPLIENRKIDKEDINWSGASVSLGLSDMRGVREPITANINGTEVPMSAGVSTNNLMPSRVSAGITRDQATSGYSFRFVVNLTGSERINFIPVGKSTTVSVSSHWPSPSFCGAYLPSDRSISDKGFSATWRILDLNRNYPQQWLGNAYQRETERSAFGVGLYSPVDFYHKAMRVTKYAILFVVLTFAAFFISELITKVRLHPMQYLLVGLAIITFYSLLLSLAGHMDFRVAYAVSGSAVVGLVTAYAASILKSTKLAIIVGGVLLMIYAYSYWLLQMIDYALLAGSVGLFTVLSIIMFVSRRVDWYSIMVVSPSPAQPAREEV